MREMRVRDIPYNITIIATTTYEKKKKRNPRQILLEKKTDLTFVDL